MFLFSFHLVALSKEPWRAAERKIIWSDLFRKLSKKMLREFLRGGRNWRLKSRGAMEEGSQLWISVWICVCWCLNGNGFTDFTECWAMSFYEIGWRYATANGVIRLWNWIYGTLDTGKSLDKNRWWDPVQKRENRMEQLDHSSNANKGCRIWRAALPSIELSICFAVALNKASVTAIRGQVLPLSTLVRKFQLDLYGEELCNSFCNAEITFSLFVLYKKLLKENGQGIKGTTSWKSNSMKLWSCFYYLYVKNFFWNSLTELTWVVWRSKED